MGFFDNLFGNNNIQLQPPQLQSILPQQAVSKIASGKLPILTSDKLVISKTEKCHYIEVGEILTERTHYESNRVGGSYHVWKGFTIHRGASRSDPVKEPELTKGILFFTNTRIAFVASKNGFDQKINKLTAVTPYTDAIELQFGNKTYRIFLPDGNIAKSVLDLII